MAIIEVKVPELAESITEVTLAQWLVEDGETVEMDQAICEMETDKASQELYAEKEGKVEYVASEGDDLPIGAVICKIDTSFKAEKEETQEEKKAEKASSPVVVEEKAEKTSYAQGHASPAAAKLMTEKGLSAKNITGSGRDGRITKQDVLQSAEGQYLKKETKLFSRDQREEKVSRLRKTVSERLVYAKNSTAMLTTFNEVNMEPILAIRKKYKEAFAEKHHIGLGFMSFFTKACSYALQQFPAVNAYIDVERGVVTYHDFVDVSIAVSTPKGLVVPVIRNAESLSMADIEREVKTLAVKGRDGELTMEEMTGGTFTITNGGVFGSLLSTPILNPPQSAILGMHKIEERPIAENGRVVIKPMMYVALSYDHRIIDGKESVSFLVAVKEYLENPDRLFVGKDPVEVLLDL